MHRILAVSAVLLALCAVAGCGSDPSPSKTTAAPQASAQPVSQPLSAARVAHLTILARPDVCLAVINGVEDLPFAEAAQTFAAGYPHEAGLPPADEVFVAILSQCR